MKTLLILATMPDNLAAALDYGGGSLPWWAGETLRAAFLADFDGSQWEFDVARLFGVVAEDTDNAFSVSDARFVDAGTARKVRALLRSSPPFRPSLLACPALAAEAKGGAE